MVKTPKDKYFVVVHKYIVVLKEEFNGEKDDMIFLKDIWFLWQSNWTFIRWAPDFAFGIQLSKLQAQSPSATHKLIFSLEKEVNMLLDLISSITIDLHRRRIKLFYVGRQILHLGAKLPETKTSFAIQKHLPHLKEKKMNMGIWKTAFRPHINNKDW